MSAAEQRFERIVTAVPGPRSQALRARLARFEPPGVTYLGDAYPVFWTSADGALVCDVDGNRYLDLTAAFGVANVGHTNARVAAAIGAQAQQLIHAMGDVHPSDVKTLLLERLAELAPGDLQKTYLTTGGAEAIEFALKTALLATGKSRFIAYRGAYHGLSLGALEVAGIPKFRTPFASLIGDRTTWLRFPETAADLDGALTAARTTLDNDPQTAAIVVEPIQGRGGVIVPPCGFLAGLRSLCDARGVLLVFDEIYTGFGRTGTMFACEREGVVPDLLCMGKALAGGVPLAATIGRAAVMDAWPKSTGEALHTATFAGNPLACAAALATIDELVRLDLVARVRARAAAFAQRLQHFLSHHPGVVAVRGTGYLHAVEFATPGIANKIVVEALARGVIVLQSGPTGTSITFAPPLVIGDDQLARALDIVESCVPSGGSA